MILIIRMLSRDEWVRGKMRKFSMALGTGLLAGTAALGSLAAVMIPAASATTAATKGATAATAPRVLPDGPGFAYGTDSWPVTIKGSGPYQEPVIGSRYGGYMGMAGNWARTEGCKTGNFLAWAPANAAQANTNLTRYNTGVGTGVYWYMGGPGVDPKWNGTTTEAYRWGQLQASWALAAMQKLPVKYPVVWADIEMPLIAPAKDNGWNSVYSSPCSGVVVKTSVPAVIDRTEFNGFATYITTHSPYKVGVYSAPQIWASIFGTGTYASIPNTYEWTYWPETAKLSQQPSGWCLRGSSACAQFFGGQTSASKYALMWQWSGGGGITNGVGDFDQINVARLK
jgi:hypothetical protein